MLTPNRISRDMDRVFNSFFNFHPTRHENHEFMPRVDVTESNENLVLTFELPGMEKGEIKVSVKDDILSVNGERKTQETNEGENYVRSEIHRGSFCRSFTLPDTVETENVSADYKNGLLIVSLPKKEEVKPKEIDIRIK